MNKCTKTILLLVSTFIFSVIVSTVVYFDMNNAYQIDQIDIAEIQNSENLIYEVNNISTEGYVILQGYAYFSDTEISSNLQIGLYDETTNELIKLPTVIEEVTDIGNVGFYAKISKDEVDSHKSYDIVLIFNETEYYNLNESLKD